jgi:diaminobutyrate-2-oxoglutarate transaminase
MTDVENNHYIDCLAGSVKLALGHDHHDVMQSIKMSLPEGLPLHTLSLTTR